MALLENLSTEELIKIRKDLDQLIKKKFNIYEYQLSEITKTPDLIFKQNNLFIKQNLFKIKL